MAHGTSQCRRARITIACSLPETRRQYLKAFQGCVQCSLARLSNRIHHHTPYPLRHYGARNTPHGIALSLQQYRVQLCRPEKRTNKQTNERTSKPTIHCTPLQNMLYALAPSVSGPFCQPPDPIALQDRRQSARDRKRHLQRSTAISQSFWWVYSVVVDKGRSCARAILSGQNRDESCKGQQGETVPLGRGCVGKVIVPDSVAVVSPVDV